MKKEYSPERAIQEIVPHWATKHVSNDRRVADTWRWADHRGWGWSAFISNGNIHLRCYPVSWKLRDTDYPSDPGILETMADDIEKRITE